MLTRSYMVAAKWATRSALAAGALMVAAMSAHAVPIQAGQSVEDGDKRFTVVSCTPSAAGNANASCSGSMDPIAGSEIGVTFTGLTANANGGGSSADVTIVYDVEVLNDQFQISAISARFTGGKDGPSATARVDESVVSGGQTVGNSSISAPNDFSDPPAEFGDNIILDFPVKTARVTKDIFVAGADCAQRDIDAGVNCNLGDPLSANISEATQDFKQIPVPATLGLLGLGLIGLGVAARRRG